MLLTLSVNGGQIGVLKEGDEVSLGCFLESHHSRRLETKIGLDSNESIDVKADNERWWLTLKS